MKTDIGVSSSESELCLDFSILSSGQELHFFYARYTLRIRSLPNVALDRVAKI